MSFAKYTHDGELIRNPVILNCGKGRTKQAHKQETDINFIMKKYQKTGLVNFVNRHQGEYMEVDPIDFQQAMEMVTNANTMFADLPSNLRSRFNNSPKEFYEFVNSEANVEEIYSLGLANKPLEATAEGETNTPTGETNSIAEPSP